MLALGVHGMSAAAGFTTPNMTERDTNRALVDAGQALLGGRLRGNRELELVDAGIDRLRLGVLGLPGIAVLVELPRFLRMSTGVARAERVRGDATDRATDRCAECGAAKGAGLARIYANGQFKAELDAILTRHLPDLPDPKLNDPD